MVDPITLTLAGAAVGGVGGVVATRTMNKLLDLGSRWLSKKYEGHADNVKENVKKNTEAFLIKLSLKVDELEKASKEHEGELEKIEKVYDDPDFALALQDAMITSSRTSDGDIHELLSSVIEERIKARDKDLIKVVLNEAIRTIGKLTKNQLKIISLLRLLKYTDLSSIVHEELMDVFLETQVKEFLDINRNITDFQHIQYTGCGYYDVTISLKKFMAKKCPIVFMKDIEPNQINHIEFPSGIKEKLFNFNKERNVFRFNILSTDELEKFFSSNSLDNEIKYQTSAIHGWSMSELGNHTESIEQSYPLGKQLIKVLNDPYFSRFSLTSIGLAIGIKYFEQITSFSPDFDSWFDDEFNQKITEKLFG